MVHVYIVTLYITGRATCECSNSRGVSFLSVVGISYKVEC